MSRVIGSINPAPGQPGDTTPPSEPGSVQASSTSATTGTVTWTASTDDVGVAGYEVFVDGSPVDTTTDLSYGLTGLSPSTQYSVTVTAFDAAGNNSTAGGPALFTTASNSAPVWSLGDQAYETGESVSIDLDTVCTDVDGDTINYSLVSGTLPSGLSLSGTRNELLSGTVDTVEVQNVTLGASDGIAATQSLALTFTITAPDTVAPSAPTGLTVTNVTSGSITLDWDDNVESDLNHYDVERSTVSASGPWGKRNAADILVSSYQDTGLSGDTTYWYRVTATDDSGNESTPSAVVFDTTLSVSGIDMSIVPQDRRTTWNPGIYGGIPPDNADAATFPNGVGPAIQHGATLTPSGGDDFTQINNSLNAAAAVATKASRRIVQLGTGTFNISANITIPSYVILRGTLGANNARQTIISVNFGGQDAISISGTRPGVWAGTTLHKVQGTVAKGDNTITLDTVAGLNVGDLIKLDDLADGDRSAGHLQWFNEVIQGNTERIADTSTMARDWDDTPTETLACVHGESSLSFTRADYSDPNFNNNFSFPDSPANGDFSGGWRFISETKEILAINGNTITVGQSFSNYAQSSNADVSGAPVRMWYYRDPEVYRCAGASGVSAEYAGLEDLEVWVNSKPISINNAKFCWFKNLEVNGRNAETGKGHAGRMVKFDSHTYRCEIKSCYAHDQSTYFPGGNYGINIAGSDNYIHDNVVRNHNKPICLEASCGGNVMAYNYIDNAILYSTPNPLPGWNETGIGSHASFTHNELVEGNTTPNVTFDSEHGNNGFNLIFRNHLRGYNTNSNVDSTQGHDASNGFANGNYRRAVTVEFLQWETTSIGNVCGDLTVPISYLDATYGQGNRRFNLVVNSYAYAAGYNGFEPGRSNVANWMDDDFSWNNLWIDRDYIYNSLQGGNQFYNKGPTTTEIIPDSLHRTTAPDYFSGYTWPPVDSEGATKYTTIPAQARYEAGEA